MLFHKIVILSKSRICHEGSDSRFYTSMTVVQVEILEFVTRSVAPSSVGFRLVEYARKMNAWVGRSYGEEPHKYILTITRQWTLLNMS